MRKMLLVILDDEGYSEDHPLTEEVQAALESVGCDVSTVLASDSKGPDPASFGDALPEALLASVVQPTEGEWRAISDAYGTWEQVEAAVILYGKRVATQARELPATDLQRAVKDFMRVALVELDVAKAFASIPSRAMMDRLRLWAQI